MALKDNYLDKAQVLYERILNETQNKSYVAMHNLGIVYEKREKPKKAIVFYEKCTYLVNDLSKTPELNKSLNRINNAFQQE